MKRPPHAAKPDRQAPTSDASPERAGALELRVRETAGLARYGYPLSLRVPLPRGVVPDAEHLALEWGGETLRGVQYDALSLWPDRTLQWALVSVNLSLAPLEERAFRLRFGEGVSHPEPGSGVVLESPEEYLIRGVYRVARRGPDFLRSLRYGTREFLRRPARWDLYPASPETPAYPTAEGSHASRVLAAGPVSAGVELVGAWESPEGSIPYRVILFQPNSKSWFDARLWLDNRPRKPLVLRLTVPFLVEKEPVRYDFGVGSWVYGTLRAGESAVLETEGPEGWALFAGRPPADRKAHARSSPLQPLVEGWAHLIDGAPGGRAVAFGSADFARPGAPACGTIQVGADGETSLTWRLPVERRLQARALFHQVSDPVHVTAVTSPTSMLHPLQVELPAGWHKRCGAGRTVPSPLWP